MRAMCCFRIAILVFAILILLMALAGVSFASSHPLPQSGTSASLAKVTFSLNFPESDPGNYSIAIDANGHARFETTGPVVTDSQPDTYRSEFEVSPETRQRIFEWAKQANYFAGKLDSGNRKLAFTGTKILAYEDAGRHNSAQYDYSNLSSVRQLTTFFQGMAATLEYGRRLAYYHRYQKLALDDELKRMETQVRDNELSELQSVVPVLEDIVNDNSVMNVTRARARDLAQLGNNNGVISGHNAR
jgi:hypothetical protein